MRRFNLSEIERARLGALYLIISALCTIFILFGILWVILLWKSS
jgi:hypothetical protein